MVVLKHEIEIDLDAPDWSSRLYLVQGTDNEITMHIQKAGEPYDLTGIGTAVLVSQPSRRGSMPVTSTATITDAENGVVVVKVLRRVFEYPGIVKSQLKLYGEENRGQLSSTGFEIEVERSTDKDYQPAEDELSFIEQNMADVKAATEAAAGVVSTGTEVIEGANSAIIELNEVTESNRTKWLPEVNSIAERDAKYPEPQNGWTITVINDGSGKTSAFRFQTDVGWVKTNEVQPTVYGQLSQQIADTGEAINQLDRVKAGTSYVDAKVQAANIAWKESYATLADLQAAYPTGDTFNHVVLDDGMIYSWANGAWNNTQVQANGTGIAPNSVTPEKTTFMQRTENLFDGNYLDKVMAYATATPEGFYTRNNFDPHRGSLAVIPIEPNETYSVKVFDEHNYFRIGVHSSYPVFSDAYDQPVDRVVVNNTAPGAVSAHTFTNDEAGRYALVYVSNTGQRPRMQFQKGTEASEYTHPFEIANQYMNKELISDVKDIKELVGESELDTLWQRTAIAVEHAVTGYPQRPNASSVIWIGVNEPPNPEPFDEWREVGGFTYFTDFEDYTPGTAPADWPVVWGAMSENTITQDNNFRFRPSANGLNGVEWTGAPNSGDADSEIYLSGNASYIAQSAMLQSIHRGAGSTGSETGYVFGIRGTSTIEQQAAITAYENGTTTRLHTINVNIDPLKKYHQVSRVDGSRLRFKIWQDGQPEPAEWMMDIVSTRVSSPGFSGATSYHTASANIIHSYGVGYGGMKAPRRRVR